MNCEKCKAPARCLETRYVKRTGETRRRYMCCACGFRFTTRTPADAR